MIRLYSGKLKEDIELEESCRAFAAADYPYEEDTQALMADEILNSAKAKPKKAKPE